MSRMPHPEVRFNELGDGVKIGDHFVKIEKCPKRGFLGGFTKPQEYRLVVWGSSDGADRFWSGKKFTL